MRVFSELGDWRKFDGTWKFGESLVKSENSMKSLAKPENLMKPGECLMDPENFVKLSGSLVKPGVTK